MAKDDAVRVAVVGLGHIAQVAVLPAFAQAKGVRLAALVSNDDVKRKELGKRYEVDRVVAYDGLDALLEEGAVDAIYIALPNHLHCEYALRAARQGVHVLCEKPMAVTEAECEHMIRAAEDNHIRLMIAYRLHFEAINMEAVELVAQEAVGMPRLFQSEFCQDVKEGDVRLMPIDQGGGSVYDMGVYCINAARYLFRDEPTEVTACSVSPADRRFEDCDEMTSAILRFPGERLATFTSSFGAFDVARYRVIGTRGELVVDPAYDYATPTAYTLQAEGDERKRWMDKRDQFAPQLTYFAECIRQARDPEPDGLEGLADVRIVRAVYQAARQGAPVKLAPVRQRARPTRAQVMNVAGIEKPLEVRVAGPKR